VACVLQSVVTQTSPSAAHWVAAVLVAVSTWMHAKYPPVPAPSLPASTRQEAVLEMEGARPGRVSHPVVLVLELHSHDAWLYTHLLRHHVSTQDVNMASGKFEIGDS
jgi:hypothetical protein